MKSWRIEKYSLFCILVCISLTSAAQSDSVNIDRLRTESGVDPTRVQSRAGYTFIIQDIPGNKSLLTNRAVLTLGVNRWSFAMKYEVLAGHDGIPGSGFKTSGGDIRFNILNAFYVKGKIALAGNVEFSIPTAKPGFGVPYLSATPALTFSYTIDPTLFLAVQPQYTFDLARDEAYPDLSVLTIRSFLAKFTKTGYFFVFEPRPVFDFEMDKVDFVVSPIIGKSLGAGFNLIILAEIPLTENLRNARGNLFQFGFNKNF
jgi:hypothetical protein